MGVHDCFSSCLTALSVKHFSLFAVNGFESKMQYLLSDISIILNYVYSEDCSMRFIGLDIQPKDCRSVAQTGD